jgi:DNA-binding MarR family transcriptional regulator
VNAESRSELAEEFLQFIGTVIRGMGAVFRRETEKYDITWPQFHLLKMVKRADRITVTELSNSLMIAPPTASRMIDGLCSKGLLVKAKDSSDQRVTLVKLTPKSQRLLDKLFELQNQALAGVLEGEDIEELRRDITNLSRITDKWLATIETTSKKGATNG